MRVIRNIIFDLDGTLADSKLGIINSQVYVFDSVGVRVSEADLLRAIGQGWGLRKVFPHFLPGIDGVEIERLVALYREHYTQTMMDFTTPFEGTLETLESLKARGFGLAVATDLMQGSPPKEPTVLHTLLNSDSTILAAASPQSRSLSYVTAFVRCCAASSTRVSVSVSVLKDNLRHHF